MSNIKLRVEDLKKSYGDEVAVDGLSLTVEHGKLTSLLGPSGCGKTTTLRCIAGLERPDSGRIYIDDELVSAPEDDVYLGPAERGIGMVFQSYAIWPHMTVEENVIYPLKVQGVGTKAERREKTEDVLDRVGLRPYASNLATNLSGGQQQRVAIARALVVEPDILLFDEPLSNLDAKLRRDMRLEIRELYQEFNTTVLYVTHSQDEAMFLSDEIAIMLEGQIIEEGDPVSLHRDPKTFFGMNFMGQCNTYRGVVEGRTGSTATVATSIGDFRVENVDDQFDSGSEVFLCFRPKNCRLLSEGPAIDEGNELLFEGELRMRSATRDFFEYRIGVGNSTMLLRSMEPTTYDIGDSVQFAVDQRGIKIFDRDEGQRVVDANQADVSESADGVEFTAEPTV